MCSNGSCANSVFQIISTGYQPSYKGAWSQNAAYNAMLQFLTPEQRAELEADRAISITTGPATFSDLVGSRFIYSNKNFLTCSTKSGTCDTRGNILDFGSGVPSSITRPNMYGEDVSTDVLLTLMDLGNNVVEYKDGSFVAKCDAKKGVDCSKATQFAQSLNTLRQSSYDTQENVRTVLLNYECPANGPCHEGMRREVEQVINGKQPNQQNLEDGQKMNMV